MVTFERLVVACLVIALAVLSTLAWIVWDTAVSVGDLVDTMHGHLEADNAARTVAVKWTTEMEPGVKVLAEELDKLVPK